MKIVNVGDEPPAGRRRELPQYLSIAAGLREQIDEGRFAPGAMLPSESQLMVRHGVSRSVAKWAMNVLKADGLADGRQGKGVFVRQPERHVRDVRHESPISHLASGSVCGGHLDPSTNRSEKIDADPAIALRLAVLPGDPVVRFYRRYRSDAGMPLEVVTSWRPAGLKLPADDVTERVIVRPARPDEIAALELPARGSVLAIARTRTAHGVPVEVADIVIPSDLCELVYRLPIG
jgi:GntR family transcriptional regulator